VVEGVPLSARCSPFDFFFLFFFFSSSIAGEAMLGVAVGCLVSCFSAACAGPTCSAAAGEAAGTLRRFRFFFDVSACDIAGVDEAVSAADTWAAGSSREAGTVWDEYATFCAAPVVPDSAT
jgi:hypothetical protein